MTSLHKMLAVSAAVIGLGAIGFSKIGVAQSTSADVVGELASNEGIYVDAKTFKIARGKAKNDPTGQLAKLGAKEIAPGALIFRSGSKLYIIEGMPQPTPQAMKDLQDNYASYMTAVKTFQDQFPNYMNDKNFQDQYANYMKDPKFAEATKGFQDQWASYMNGKSFQDNWASYMNNKNFQDDWKSYMNAKKEFQDNWATGYMK